MAENLASNRCILFLTLDRLIKERFLDKLDYYLEKGMLDENKEVIIRQQISRHNTQLLNNLYLNEKEANTGNRQLQFITKLYGFKNFHPQSNYKAWHKVSIQSYIDEFANINIPSNSNLSFYFYDKLNKYVKTNDGAEDRELPKISQDRLKVLFNLAIPEKNLKTWKELESCKEASVIIEKLKGELSERDENFQEFFNFEGSYYSRSRKKIHNFNLQFSKEYTTDKEKGINKGKAILSFQKDKLLYKGNVVRSGNNLTVNLLSPEGNKRVILFAIVPKAAKFDKVNVIQGHYIGDSVKREGVTFSMEFIAAKKHFLEDQNNQIRIISNLLLRRNNFDIQPFDLTTNKLEKSFSDSNLIHCKASLFKF